MEVSSHSVDLFPNLLVNLEAGTGPLIDRVRALSGTNSPESRPTKRPHVCFQASRLCSLSLSIYLVSVESMIQTGLIQNAHNDLVTDAAYDFYGLRLATCSLDQRSAVSCRVGTYSDKCSCAESKYGS